MSRYVGAQFIAPTFGLQSLPVTGAINDAPTKRIPTFFRGFLGLEKRRQGELECHLMNPISKHLHLLFNLISFFWLLLTTLSALFITRFSLQGVSSWILSPLFHPQWSTLTIALLILMNLYWVRHQPKTAKPDPDFSSRRYLIVFGLIAVFMTGIAAQMKFLPFFFHQLFVWPLIVAMLWDFVRCLRNGVKG